MKKLVWIIVLLVSFFAVTAAFAQTNPVVVRVHPELSQIALNQTASVAVEVVDVIEVYGIDITMTFDPAILEVVDADPNLEGVQLALGEFLDPGFVIINQADNEAGVLRLAMAQLHPSTPKSGTGNLIVINFLGKTLSDGTDLDLVSVKMARNNGVLIENTAEPGVAEVVEEIPGPTNTPIPTQGAGTPLPTATQRSTNAPTSTSRPAASSTPQPATVTETSVPTDSPTATSTAPLATETNSPEIQDSPTFTPTSTAIDATQVSEGASPSDEGEQAIDDGEGAKIPVQQATETTYPLFLMLGIGLSGALIGGLFVYFLGMRRKEDEKQSQSESDNDK